MHTHKTHMIINFSEPIEMKECEAYSAHTVTPRGCGSSDVISVTECVAYNQPAVISRQKHYCQNDDKVHEIIQ